MKDQLKFWVKCCVSGVRKLLLRILPVQPNQEDWEHRLLIVNLDLIGDIVVLSSVLQYYRDAFPGKKLYMLLSRNVHPVFVADFVDEVIQIDSNAFKSNPWYGYQFVKKLRHVGFATVIDQNAGTEFNEKSLVTELGAKELIGYEGWRIDFDKPFSANAALGAQYFKKNLLPKFTKVIPRINEKPDAPRLRHMILHYAAIFEGATGLKKLSSIPRVPATPENDSHIGTILSENHIAPHSYCTLSLGTSSAKKDWPVERFIEIGIWLRDHGIPIVLTGGPSDAARAAAFETGVGKGVLNLVGKTNVLDLVSLIRFSKLVVSNDTALTHIAVALGKPSLTILAMGHIGRMSLYGRKDINRWVYQADAPCRCDNMQCMNTVGPTKPAPCLQAVTVQQVIHELDALLKYLDKKTAAPDGTAEVWKSEN